MQRVGLPGVQRQHLQQQRFGGIEALALQRGHGGLELRADLAGVGRGGIGGRHGAPAAQLTLPVFRFQLKPTGVPRPPLVVCGAYEKSMLP